MENAHLSSHFIFTDGYEWVALGYLPLTPNEMASEKHQENLEWKALNYILYPVFREKNPTELKAIPEEHTCFNSTLREHTGTKISAGREWKARNFHAIPQIFKEEFRRLLKEREKRQWIGQDEDFQGSCRSTRAGKEVSELKKKLLD